MDKLERIKQLIEELNTAQAIILMESVCEALGLDCSNKIDKSWDKILKEIRKQGDKKD